MIRSNSRKRFAARLLFSSLLYIVAPVRNYLRRVCGAYILGPRFNFSQQNLLLLPLLL